MELSKIVLNSKEHKLLNQINFITSQSPHGLVKLESVQKLPNYEQYYLSELHRLGLIGFRHYSSKEDQVVWHAANSVYSTPDGLHYNDWNWTHLKMFCCRSVLTPIIVSVVVNALVLLFEKIVKN